MVYLYNCITLNKSSGQAGVYIGGGGEGGRGEIFNNKSHNYCCEFLYNMDGVNVMI